MKRVLLYSVFLFVIGLSHQRVAGQAACPQFIDSTFRLLHPAGDPNPCDWQIRIEFYNPTMGVKSFKFLALCGSDTALNQCVDASHFKDSLRYDTSNVFTCCVLGSLTVRLIAYTANSTICIGAACIKTSMAGAPLPVFFKGFTAMRVGALVDLNWATASEDNNKVFVIERKTVNDDWASIGYVNSAAPGGNSSGDLAYSFTDHNGAGGTTLYRLKQVDLDGQFFFSEVRAVEGLTTGGSSVIIYPNPGRNGQTNVTFKDLSQQYNLTLIDVNGKIIKQWADVHRSNFHITGLMPGWYNLLIIAKQTGTQTVAKFVISR